MSKVPDHGGMPAGAESRGILVRTKGQGISARAENPGMSVKTATRLEYAIIGLGLVALALIFQPVSLRLFSVGCGLVVLAGLVNNLLPLAVPGVPLRTVIRIALIVALIFVVVTALAIGSAWLYGVYLEAQRTALQG